MKLSLFPASFRLAEAAAVVALCILYTENKICISANALSIPSLSDDYAAAQLRRALEEENLLRRPGGTVELPYYSDSAGGATTRGAGGSNNNNKNQNVVRKSSRSSTSSRGGGFGGGASNNKVAAPAMLPKSATRAQKVTAAAMADDIRRNGVIRLPSQLTPETCKVMRNHVLTVQSDVADLAASEATSSSASSPFFDATDYYGVEPGRTCRTDLLLPIDATVQNTFSELLGASTPLRHLLCELFPLEAPLYEVAAVITSNGSHRQTIHPDLPHKDECPLYVVFVALQDVTPEMGPTTFLRGSQHAPLPFHLDETLSEADVVVSTLKAGDAVVFDARILHCGNANSSTTTRAIFNFSFRRPDSGPLGYEGSIRKGYIGRTCLGELLEVADKINGWGTPGGKGSEGKTLEGVYGNGLQA